LTIMETPVPREPSLKDQVAVVTGAARGIGEAVAHALATRGAVVVLTARDQARLAEVEAAIKKVGGQAAAIPCDLTHPPVVEAFGKRVAEIFGRCDILVNNAGLGLLGKPLVECTLEEWTRLMDTNLRGPFLMIRALAPMMIAARAGHIVNISSLAGRNPLPNGAAYAASKWGLNGLTYSLAEELRQYGVRVSAIAPGSVNTRFGATAGSSNQTERAPRQEKDRSKMIQPADVAEAVLQVVTQPANAFISEVLLRPTIKP
jgi:3-oxoacyl-[acyl-carrier protein] reductase